MRISQKNVCCENLSEECLREVTHQIKYPILSEEKPFVDCLLSDFGNVSEVLSK